MGGAQNMLESKPCRTLPTPDKIDVKIRPEEHFRPIPSYHNTYSSKEPFNNGVEKSGTIKVCANYYIPLVSGYMGYLPGKKAENLMGGGLGPMARQAQELFSSRDRGRKKDSIS